MFLNFNKIILLLFIYTSNTIAYQINPLIYKGILHNECLKINKQCYPFFLRVNSKLKDVKKILKNENIKFNSKVIDCKNKLNCIQITNKLIKNTITNIDLGPFQINYFHNKKINIKNLYDIETAKFEVEKILKRLINKYGYSWKTLGKYHSFKNGKNQRYYLKMYTYFKNNNML